MGTAQGGRTFRWYVAVVGAMTLAHPLIPVDARVVTYTAVTAATLLPLVTLMRRQRPQERLPWKLLAVAMTILTVANALTPIFGKEHALAAENTMTLGHVFVLAAAIALALRRGRNDLGGLIDLSVGAVGFGGLLWITLLHPKLEEMKAGLGAEISVLVSLLVLVAVLGALSRIWIVADRRLPALEFLIVALVVSLVGNTILGMSTGSMTTGRPGMIEMLFLVGYLCVGAAPLHPSAVELSRPGPSPEDRLTAGRLAFLGVALIVNPVAGGARELFGLSADGPLLVFGSLVVAPLVMIRVGRLAWQRAAAEQQLQYQATHDVLTSLPNRAELLTRLEAALAREQAAGRPAVVLLFCDLNGFKAVNDRLGHLAGDQLLQQVAERIRGGLRHSDTVARYGGDEFLVLCEEPVHPHAAVARLTRHIEEALTRPFVLEAETVRISTAVGAVISDGRHDADELITRADLAMYGVKQRRPAAVVA